MRTYRYDRYDNPQSALDDDIELAKRVHRWFIKLQNRVSEAVHLAEESGFQHSLKEINNLLDDFISDEVEPIMTLLENAQDDIDKETTA